ncbi:MAG: hypothetical protein U9O98_08590 [Asgard group archaeon]|nr:hypothetical protein [Asgard group archaeon]
MPEKLTAKEINEIYKKRPWINKHALSNLFLEAFAETVIPAMDKAMGQLYKKLISEDFILKIEQEVVDEAILRLIKMIKEGLREEMIEQLKFED